VRRSARLVRTHPFGLVIVVEEVTRGRALPVVEVATRNGAHDEREQPTGEQQTHGDGDPEETHRRGRQASKRTALPVTTSDDRLIAIAAGSGSSAPKAASGTATTL
jgi:hypothetical protein